MPAVAVLAVVLFGAVAAFAFIGVCLKIPGAIRWAGGLVWCLPGSIAGLVLALVFGARLKDFFFDRGCLWATCPRVPGIAATFGHVVLAKRALTAADVRHELVHVFQWRAWGVFFVPAYLLAGLFAVAGGAKFASPHNAFESAAYAAEEDTP